MALIDAIRSGDYEAMSGFGVFDSLEEENADFTSDDNVPDDAGGDDETQPDAPVNEQPPDDGADDDD